MSKKLNRNEEISKVGREIFSIREMLKLGFLKKEEAEKLEISSTEIEEIYQLNLVNETKIRAKYDEISELPELENVIAETRSKRIKRVKDLRVLRNAERAIRSQQLKDILRERKLTEPYFLGRGVSSELKFTEPDQQKLDQLKLPILRNIMDVAKLVGLSREEIVWLCYERKVSAVDHYLRFEIPKRSGGKRLISSPKKQMRTAQSGIREKILRNLVPTAQATAFRPNKSIVDNALAHVGAKIIVRVDLKDFFPSISFRRVRGYFKWCGYSPGIATVLALLTTDAPRVYVNTVHGKRVVARGERGLPQGACTSPDLANLIARGLDQRIQGLASKNGEWIFTRYADDLVLSTKNPESNAFGLAKTVERICRLEGFEVNTKKTSIKRPAGRMIVTGLVVHENSVQISKADIKRMRAFFHRCDKEGRENISKAIGKSAESVAKGYLAYMQMVSPELANKYRSRYPWL
jgi:hypothetical protein